MKKADMSDAAITRRLKTVDQLRTLCLSLMRAKRESDKKNEKPRKVTAKSKPLKKNERKIYEQTNYDSFSSYRVGFESV